MHLGVDPGHDGAAVLVAASGVRAWRWYDRRGRKTSPGYDLAEGGVELLHGVSLARIGHTVGVASVGAALVVEGLFVGANGDAALDLAETTGRLLAGLEGAGLRPRWRPTWSVWARQVVGKRPTTAELEAARPGWLAQHGLPDLGADDHVLDAACLAIYGRLSSAPLTQADPTSFDPDATASEPQTRAGRNPAKTKGREDCHPRDPASNLKQRGST